MSRAFTREQDSDQSMPELGERPVSTHRNLVTRAGMTQIETEIALLHQAVADAENDGDREKVALAARDLRYWAARRENAELSEPDADSKVARFGMFVTVEGERGIRHKWHIVGEDEADAAHGKISHVSPMAAAMFGKTVGDVAEVNGKAWKIVAVDAVD